MLHQRTEGWAAGLRLAVLSLDGNPNPERFVAEFSGNDRTVAEYLMAEMLDRQPPEVQRLLLRTFLLDQVNGELAVAHRAGRRHPRCRPRRRPGPRRRSRAGRGAQLE